MTKQPLVTVDSQSRVWLKSDPTIELVANRKNWRHSKVKAYWRVRQNGKWLSGWHLTTTLAIAAADL